MTLIILMSEDITREQKMRIHWTDLRQLNVICYLLSVLQHYKTRNAVKLYEA